MGILDQQLNLKRKIRLLLKIKDDAVSANYDVIVISPIYGCFGAVWKPDSACMVYNYCNNYNYYTLLSGKN